jgi:hypothetical protein
MYCRSESESWWSPRLMPSFLDDATWAGLFHVSSDSDEEEEEEDEEEEEEEEEEDEEEEGEED